MFTWKPRTELHFLLHLIKNKTNKTQHNKTLPLKKNIHFPSSFISAMTANGRKLNSVIHEAKIVIGCSRSLCPECVCSATKPIKLRVQPSSRRPRSPSPALSSSGACQAAFPAGWAEAALQQSRLEAERKRFPNPFYLLSSGTGSLSGLGKAVTLVWFLPVHWDFSSPKSFIKRLQYFFSSSF